MENYYIGQIFEEMYPSEAAQWCNENKAYIAEIENIGDLRRFEIFAVPEETPEEKRERINSLNLTKADFWIALLDGGITKDMVKEKIQLIPDEILKIKTLIRLDEADHFWRGDASMDVIGAMFGITSDDLDYLFENKALPSKEEIKN